MESDLPDVTAKLNVATDSRLITAARDGDVCVIADRFALDQFISEIDPTAPIAVDAERAQSFRYSSKAYLIQFNQTACGTRLLDPIALANATGLADLSELNTALAGCEWVIHAASQDLPCLAEVGLVPQHLFDTELAGRLLGFSKVALSPMLTHYLGIQLAKAHSADDWSARPLPESWLTYAALDVDFLLELRDAVANDLAIAGKTAWADQEFANEIARFATTPDDDPERWRNVKGLGHLRQPRQLGIARNLWHVRDDLAQRLDVFPGRILPDAALVEAAANLSHLTPQQVSSTINTLTGFTGPLAKRQRRAWAGAVITALNADASQLPRRQRSQGTPPPRVWAHINKSAARRWEKARPAVIALAEEYGLPPENLMTVATLADIVWPDDLDISESGLRLAMAQANVRPWQQDLAAPVLVTALA
ncbi:MAG: HRDC domain-containing protein [Propionibacteriaceae bacterium]|nr:HRDC domain-containing protein [Propionibacteriaceae bacterium]